MIQLPHRAFLLFTALILYAIPPQQSCNAEEKSPTDSSSNKYLFTFEYLNDNFIAARTMNRMTGSAMFKELDDYVTAGFCITAVAREQSFAYSGRAALFLLTDLNNRYRADILLLQWMRYFQHQRIRWRWGIGVYGVGNFGGEWIQNTYHILSGFQEVILPYPTAANAGATISGEAEYIVVHSPSFESSIVSNVTFNSGVLPLVSQNGVLASLHSHCLKLEALLGYGYRTGASREHTSIFGSSKFFLVRGGVNVTRYWFMNGWYASGLFGILNTTHVGLGLSWNGLSVSMNSIHELLFL